MCESEAWGGSWASFHYQQFLIFVATVRTRGPHPQVVAAVIQRVAILVVHVHAVTIVGPAVLLHVTASLDPGSPPFDLVWLAMVFFIFLLVISRH